MVDKDALLLWANERPAWLHQEDDPREGALWGDQCSPCQENEPQIRQDRVTASRSVPQQVQLQLCQVLSSWGALPLAWQDQRLDEDWLTYRSLSFDWLLVLYIFLRHRILRGSDQGQPRWIHRVQVDETWRDHRGLLLWGDTHLLSAVHYTANDMLSRHHPLHGTSKHRYEWLQLQYAILLGQQGSQLSLFWLEAEEARTLKGRSQEAMARSGYKRDQIDLWSERPGVRRCPLWTLVHLEQPRAYEGEPRATSYYQEEEPRWPSKLVPQQ